MKSLQTFLGTILVLASAHSVKGVDATWNGTTSAAWATAGNWSASPVPASGNTATFSTAGNGNTTIDLGAGVTINTVLFDNATAGAYTLGSGGVNAQTLTLNNGGAVSMYSDTANDELINARLILGTSTTSAATNTFNAWAYLTTPTKSLIFAGDIAGGPGGAPRKLILSSTSNGSGGKLFISGAISDGGASSLSLVKSSAGLVSLSGSNSYSGTTTISAGTLSIATTAALPGWNSNGWYSVASGSTLAVGNGVSDADLATILATGNFAAGARIGFDTSAGDRTYANALTDTAAGGLGLTKIGNHTLTLSGLHSYSGPTLVSGGTLVVTGTNAASAVIVTNGAVLAGDGVLNGPVTIQSSGVLAPGSSLGTLTINNALTLAAGSTTRMELSKSPLANDFLSVSGLLNYGGTLSVTNLGGTLAAGDSFKLFDASAWSSDFSALDLPALPLGLTWAWSATNGTLSVVASQGSSQSASVPVVRILPLGDSITFGDSSGGWIPGGYRLPLYNLLTNAGYFVHFTGTQTNNAAAGQAEPLHEGHPGWRIDEIDAILEKVFASTPDPDVLLLLIGTNDYGQDYNEKTATNRLDQLIWKITVSRPACRVIVASLTPRNDSNNSVIQSGYNPAIPGIVARNAALGRRVYFTDMYSAVPLSSGISGDGVHPNRAGYSMMATNWFKAITNVLPLEVGSTMSSKAPVVWRAVVQPGLNSVVLSCSKPLDDSATNTANFALDGGLSVLKAELDPACLYNVVLTTSPLAPDTLYTLTLNNVRDRTDNHIPMAANSVVTFRTQAPSWKLDADGNWSAALNWDLNPLPNAIGATAVLTNALTAARKVTLDTDVTLGGLWVGMPSGSQTFTLATGTGKHLTFNNNGAGALIRKAGSGADVISAAITLADSLTILSGGLSISGAIGETAGARSLVTVDDVTLSGASTYSGGTLVLGGRLSANSNTALGSGDVVVTNGAQLSLPSGTTLANNISIAGSGLDGGSLYLVSAKTTRTLSGTLTVSADAQISDPNSIGMNLKVTGPMNLAGSLTLYRASAATAVQDWAFNGAIRGSGGLVYNLVSATNSTLTLGAANTFSGDTTLKGVATLVVGNALALQNSTLNFNNGGLHFASGINAFTLGGLSGTEDIGLANVGGTAMTLSVGNNSKNTTYGGVLSGAGGLTKIGAGVLTLSGTNTYSGNTVITNGTLRLTHSLCLSSNTTVWLWSGATNDLAFSGTNTVYALYVDGQPKAAGVYGGADLPGKLTGTGYLRTLAPVLTGYDAWAGQITNGQTGYSQSASGDGYPNLLKYATGSSPTQRDNLARLDAVMINGAFALLFHRNTNATDVTLVVEGANNVGAGAAWSGIATNSAGSWGGTANVIETGTGSPATVSITVGEVSQLATNRCFRLRVSRP